MATPALASAPLPPDSTAESILVAVRVRKLLGREQGNALPWKWNTNQLYLEANPAKKYVYDKVFTPSDTNEDVYNGLVAPRIESVVEGFNATIFAYGQTASGKTHTMLGNDSDPGVIWRAINSIFEKIEVTEQKQFLIRVSYMEIYNENLTDLLVEPGKRKNLKILEDTDGNTTIDGLNEIPVKNIEEIMSLMEIGEQHRHYGETNMNERSSRSHTIFRLVIESSMVERFEAAVAPNMDVEVDADDPTSHSGTSITFSQLNLVDLAGSERASQTGASGERLREGGNINKSLMILGQVIRKLSDGSTDHIPIRGSKLTRILKNSLGGNSRTTIICTATPAEREQTKSTLEFASRAKTIVQHTHKNAILDNGAHLARMNKQIQELQQALLEAKSSKVEVVQLREAVEKKTKLLTELQKHIISGTTDISLGKQNATTAKKDFRRRMSWHPHALAKRASMGFALTKQAFAFNDQDFLRKMDLSPELIKSSVSSSQAAAKLDSSLLDIHGLDLHIDSVFVPDDSSAVCSRLGTNEYSKLQAMDCVDLSQCIDALDLSTELLSPQVSCYNRKSRRVRFNATLDTPPPGLRKGVLKRNAAIPESPFIPSISNVNIGTPRDVLKDRLRDRDDHIKKLSVEYEELQEFTRLEKDLADDINESENDKANSAANKKLQREFDIKRNQNTFLEKKLLELKAAEKKHREDLSFLQQENENLWQEKYEQNKVKRRQTILSEIPQESSVEEESDAERKIILLQEPLEEGNAMVAALHLDLKVLEGELETELAKYNSEIVDLKEKQHATLVELASLKVSVKNEDSEYKKKLVTLAKELEVERESNHMVKEKEHATLEELALLKVSVKTDDSEYKKKFIMLAEELEFERESNHRMKEKQHATLEELALLKVSVKNDNFEYKKEAITLVKELELERESNHSLKEKQHLTLQELASLKISVKTDDSEYNTKLVTLAKELEVERESNHIMKEKEHLILEELALLKVSVKTDNSEYKKKFIMLAEELEFERESNHRMKEKQHATLIDMDLLKVSVKTDDSEYKKKLITLAKEVEFERETNNKFKEKQHATLQELALLKVSVETDNTEYEKESIRLAKELEAEHESNHGLREKQHLTLEELSALKVSVKIDNSEYKKKLVILAKELDVERESNHMLKEKEHATLEELVLLKVSVKTDVFEYKKESVMLAKEFEFERESNHGLKEKLHATLIEMDLLKLSVKTYNSEYMKELIMLTKELEVERESNHSLKVKQHLTVKELAALKELVKTEDSEYKKQLVTLATELEVEQESNHMLKEKQHATLKELALLKVSVKNVDSEYKKESITLAKELEDEHDSNQRMREKQHSTLVELALLKEVTDKIDDSKCKKESIALVKELEVQRESNHRMKEKQHATLVELASLKVSVKTDDSEYKKKSVTLAKELEFERESNHRLKDKMRRLQADRMDSTIAIPPSRRAKSARDLTMELMMEKSTSTESMERAMTRASDVGSSTDAVNGASNSRDRYDKVMEQSREAPWFCGSGVTKEFALHAAQLRVRDLEKKLIDMEKEKEHYHLKAREYKTKLLNVEPKKTNSVPKLEAVVQEKKLMCNAAENQSSSTLPPPAPPPPTNQHPSSTLPKPAFNRAETQKVVAGSEENADPNSHSVKPKKISRLLLSGRKKPKANAAKDDSNLDGGCPAAPAEKQSDPAADGSDFKIDFAQYAAKKHWPKNYDHETPTASAAAAQQRTPVAGGARKFGTPMKDNCKQQ